MNLHNESNDLCFTEVMEGLHGKTFMKVFYQLQHPTQHYAIIKEIIRSDVSLKTVWKEVFHLLESMCWRGN